MSTFWSLTHKSSQIIYMEKFQLEVSGKSNQIPSHCREDPRDTSVSCMHVNIYSFVIFKYDVITFTDGKWINKRFFLNPSLSEDGQNHFKMLSVRPSICLSVSPMKVSSEGSSDTEGTVSFSPHYSRHWRIIELQSCLIALSDIWCSTGIMYAMWQGSQANITPLGWIQREWTWILRLGSIHFLLIF